jgi:hypothetical protein
MPPVFGRSVSGLATLALTVCDRPRNAIDTFSPDRGHDQEHSSNSSQRSCTNCAVHCARPWHCRRRCDDSRDMVTSAFGSCLCELGSVNRPYTGHALPPGIRAAYDAWSNDDNPLHVCHDWLLRGRNEGMRSFARARFRRIERRSALEHPLCARIVQGDLPVERIVVGYERDQGNYDWIWIFRNEIAIYREECITS